MDSFVQILIVLFGLCWGSFLNVLIVRTESGESILYPFSKCPKCSHPLYWWHNIPIVSFLILKGKCYFCNKSISIRYPIIELAGMAILLFAFYKYISVFDALSVAVILSFFLVMSITDHDIKKISIIQALIIFISGVVFNRYDIINSLTGALISAGIVSALIFIFDRVFNKISFGVGDIFLFAAFGSVIGYDRLFLFLIYALIIQFIQILPEYILDLIKLKQIETLKYLIIFFVACLFLYVSKNINLFGANLIITVFLGIILFSAYKLVKNLLHNLKTAETSSYYPISTALAISTLLFLC